MQTNGVAPKSLSESGFLLERFAVQPAFNRISRGPHVTHLEPKAMQLLVFMADHSGEVLSREVLLNSVWGDAFVTDQVLSNTISQIRHAFGGDGKDYIETIPKSGYLLNVRPTPADGSGTDKILESTPAEPNSGTSLAAQIVGELETHPLRRDSDSAHDVAPPGGRLILYRRWIPLAVLCAVAVLAIAGHYVWRISHPIGHTGDGPQIAIAVLPFQNLGADKDKDYLRLALSDRITTALTYAPPLAVRPSAATQKYSTGVADPQLAGRELRVSRVVTGNFQEEGDTLRITVELVDVEQNRVSWRGSVAFPTSKTLELDRQVTSLVRDQLFSALKVEARAESTRPTNAEAYYLYLRSLSFSNDPIPNTEALKMLGQSVILDPHYAPAWAQFGARSYNDSRYSGGGEAVLARAEMAHEQALKLDPNLTMSIRQLIIYRTERGQLNEAWLKAQELSQRLPDDSGTGFVLSYVLRYAGLNEEAARQCDRALTLDRTNTLWRSCYIPYFGLGEYTKALRILGERDPGTQWAYVNLGRIYLAQGDKASALQNFKQLQDCRGPFMTTCLTGGPVKETASQIESYAAENDPERMWEAADMLSYCGETDRAVRLTRSAIAHNFCGYPLIERDPLLASVRSRPEYSELRASAIACQQNFLKFRKSLEKK